jgi:hypothetical protein
VSWKEKVLLNACRPCRAKREGRKCGRIALTDWLNDFAVRLASTSAVERIEPRARVNSLSNDLGLRKGWVTRPPNGAVSPNPGAVCPKDSAEIRSVRCEGQSILPKDRCKGAQNTEPLPRAWHSVAACSGRDERSYPRRSAAESPPFACCVVNTIETGHYTGFPPPACVLP